MELIKFIQRYTKQYKNSNPNISLDVDHSFRPHPRSFWIESLISISVCYLCSTSRVTIYVQIIFTTVQFTHSLQCRSIQFTSICQSCGDTKVCNGDSCSRPHIQVQSKINNFFGLVKKDIISLPNYSFSFDRQVKREICRQGCY